MILFKQNPKRIFELLLALIVAWLIYYLVGYFYHPQTLTIPNTVEPKPRAVAQEEQTPINFEEFGAVFVEVSSPSFAKSNFDVDPQTKITVYFNQPVNLSDVQSAFRLVDKATGEERTFSASPELRSDEDAQPPFAYKWQEVWQQRLIFSPTIALEPITMYTVTIGSGYRSEDSVSTAKDSFRFEFLTADEPGVLSTSVDNQDLRLAQANRLKIIFKSPMSQEELVGSLSLYSQTKGSFEAVDLQVHDKILTIDTQLAPGKYNLNIPESAKDIYKRPLGGDFNLEFEVY